jgi:hypothetical protein
MRYTIPTYGPINSPEADQFVYLLTASIMEPDEQYPKKIRGMRLGFFDSLEKAENYLREFCVLGKRDEDWDEELHHLEIEKISLNTEMETDLGTWIYHRDGTLFQACPDTEAPFPGVNPTDLKFRKKEIVEIIEYGKLQLAIIVTTPLTCEEMQRRGGEGDFHTGFIYNTITYEKGITPENIIEKRGEHFYEHTNGLDIFPVSNPLSTDQSKVMEKLYELYYTPAGE